MRTLVPLRFKPVFVPQSPEADIERCTVLRPMGGSMPHDFNDDAQVIEIFQMTLQLWRRRAREWADIDWPAYTKRPGKFINCAPACVATEETVAGRAQTCNQETVCPWCWARTSVRLYRQMRPFIPWPVGDATSRFNVHVGTGYANVPIDRGSSSMLEPALRGVEATLQTALSSLRALFSYRNVTVTPYMKITKQKDERGHVVEEATATWRIAISYLYVISPMRERTLLELQRIAELHKQLNINTSADGEERPHDFPMATAGQIKHAVQLVRRYPSLLLQSPDVQLTYNCMCTRKRLRLSYAGGTSLRNSL